MEPEILRYEPAWRDEVARLQTRMWSPDAESNKRYFAWKYQRNPVFPHPHVWLAVAGGRVVAMRGFYGARLEIGGVATPIGLPIADDAAVAADWEGRGVYRRLMSEALRALAADGFPFVINLTASPVTMLDALATGWRASAPLGSLRRAPARPTRMAPFRERLRRTPGLWRLADSQLLDTREERRPFTAFDRVLSRQRGDPLHLRVASEPRVDDMAALIARLGHDHRLRLARDPGWLGWRLANPLNVYRFLYWDDGALQGYLVLKRSVSPFFDRLCTTIVDCEAVAPEVCRQLLQAAVSLERSEIVTLAHALPAMAVPVLAELGFSPPKHDAPFARQRPCVLIRPLRDLPAGSEWTLAGQDLRDLASWDLRRI